MNNNPEAQSKYYKIYLFGFFLILALPLLAASPWFHPAAWGKAIIFRIIISSFLFLIIWQLISKKTKINFKELLDRKNKIFWPFWLLVALWAIFLLATIFSLDPYYSFWESPYRAGGFLNFSFYIIFAVLAFLIIKEKGWQKIWDFSILIGVLVSIIAIFQRFNIFRGTIMPYAGRPPSTMGGPTFLALYLVLLVFLTLSFLSKEKGAKKKLFYLFAFLLFLYVILLTESRAAYFGLFIGFFYFIFAWQKNFFPLKRKKILTVLKILFGILLISGICGIYYLNTKPELSDYLRKNKLFQGVSSRLSIDLASAEPRFSAWLISLEAIKEKPILGYGPENFSIAFDKHYNPSLPLITKDWGSWWDRAHNFLFDISVTAGIPALIIFISLIAVLFFQLQKLKNADKYADNNVDKSLKIVAHGIQATFFGYLATNFFSFDTFSTYLVFFLLIAYSLFLIQKNNKLTETRVSVNSLWRSGAVFVLFCILIAFIWFAGLKPLGLNKEINWADHYAQTDQCQKAIEKMEKDVLPSHSIIDNYAKFKYIEIINKCSGKIPGLRVILAPKVISALKEATEIRPYYTRTWLFLGNFTNLLIENSEYLKIKNIEDLKKDAYSFFEKAKELSPKREELFIGWIQTDLLFEQYQTANEKAELCTDLNPNYSQCWWLKGLSNIYLENLEQADKDIATAVENKYDSNSEKSFLQLNEAYLKMIKKTKNPKYDARLIDLYLSFEQYQAAKEQAELCISLNPNYSQCWWLKGLSNIYLENLEQADKDMAIAAENKYDIDSKESLLRLIEIYAELIKKTKNPKYKAKLTDLYFYLSFEYQTAKEKAELCISLNPKASQCWWLKGLFNIYQENIEQADKDMAIAAENKYDIDSKESLLQLAEAYSKIIGKTKDLKYYRKLTNVYQKLVLIEPDDYQRHGFLAYLYYMIEEYKKAEKEVLVAIKLAPESEKPEIEKLLESIRNKL